MKKILIICIVIMMSALCACRGNVANSTDPGVSQPTNATDPVGNDGTEPAGGVDTDPWEVPIDVDDSFNEDDLQEPTSTEAPSDPTSAGETSDPTTPADPTEPSAPAETTATTTPAEPDPTQPTEGSVNDKPVVNPDGSIDLPMIPG